MPDQDNTYGLAVRSQADGSDARVHVKIVDKTSPTTQQMTVDTDSNAHVESHGNNPTGADTVLLLSEEGAPNTDGVYDATHNTIPSTSQTVVSTRNATVDKTKQNLRQTGIQNGTVIAADVSLYDENGAPFTQTNPLPVSIQNAETGTPVHLFESTTTPVAVGTPQSMSMAALVAALTLKQLTLSASSKTKFTIFRGPSGSPVQMYTVFNSEANPTIIVPVPSNCVLAIGEILTVTCTSEMPTGTTAYTAYATVEGMQ